MKVEKMREMICEICTCIENVLNVQLLKPFSVTEIVALSSTLYFLQLRLCACINKFNFSI